MSYPWLDPAQFRDYDNQIIFLPINGEPVKGTDGSDEESTD
jgi:hypothetical protein